MTKRIQIVARIDPALRRAVARAVKRNKTTLNALVEASLEQYLGAAQGAKAPTGPPTATTESR
jgi:hypothetical protein